MQTVAVGNVFVHGERLAQKPRQSDSPPIAVQRGPERHQCAQGQFGMEREQRCVIPLTGDIQMTALQAVFTLDQLELVTGGVARSESARSKNFSWLHSAMSRWRRR